MKRPFLALALLSSLFASGVTACGTGVGPVGTPKLPSFDDVNPEEARASAAKGMTEPFVIDWRMSDREDLEVAVRKGPAIVRFDAKTFHLLTDCHAEGAYEYNGVAPMKEDKVFRSRAELHVNLPYGAAALEGELAESGQVKVAIFVVGRHSLAGEVHRAQLTGNCQGATHVVRKVTIGAFQFVAAGTRSGAASASGFGANAGGSGEGAAGVARSGGDMKSCDSADPDAEKAPAKCRAVLQVQIVPLDAEPQQEQQAARPNCGTGLRWDGSSCVSVARVRAEEEAAREQGTDSKAASGTTSKGFECDPKNAQECMEECKHGNLPSCVSLGYHMQAGSGGVGQDVQKALKLWEVACSGSEPKGCGALNVYWESQHDYRRALLWGSKGCIGGDAGSCTNIAVQAFYGRGVKENRSTAFKLWLRACKMREYQACSNAGVMIEHGMGGAPKDPAVARKLFERACQSEKHFGCGNLAGSYELGLGGPKDVAQALKLYMADCDAGNAISCVNAGLMIEENSPKPEHLRKVAEMYEKGCGFAPNGGCLTEEEMRRDLPGAYSDEGYNRRACEAAEQSYLACYNAGIAAERGYSGQIDESKAAGYLKKACDGKLQKACRSPRPGTPHRM